MTHERIEKWRSAFNNHPQQPIKFDDIVRIIKDGWSQGDYAEENGSAIAMLKDGRVASLEGGCDTTGWGCQSWFDVKVFVGVDDAWNLGLTQAGRDRINEAQLDADERRERREW